MVKAGEEKIPIVDKIKVNNNVPVQYIFSPSKL
jgi:hypothetical protein